MCLPGLRWWGKHKRWSVVCKFRGCYPLVWDRCSQGDRVHRSHYSGTGLLKWVRDKQTRRHKYASFDIPTPNNLPSSSVSNDYVTSYFLAFSNDSREWTTIHDGYADWVSSSKTVPLPQAPILIFLSPSFTCPLLCSCFSEIMIRTPQWWTSLRCPWWPATCELSHRAGTALFVWGWRS